MSLSFQSTLSVRRATAAFVDKRRYINISIHALRKESDVSSLIVSGQIGISIHALRKESDPLTRVNITPFSISIHALRKESDNVVDPKYNHLRNFNPRSP